MIRMRERLEERSSNLEKTNTLIKNKIVENNFQLKEHFVIEVELTGQMLAGSVHPWSLARPSKNINEVSSVIQCIHDFFPKTKLKLKFNPNRVKIIFNTDLVMTDPLTFMNFTSILMLGMTPTINKSKIIVGEAYC